MNSKKRLVVNYEDLEGDLRGMVKRVYPGGFKKHLMQIPSANGGSYKAFTLDTGDVLYLVKVGDEQLRSADDILAETEAYEPDEGEFDY